MRNAPPGAKVAPFKWGVGRLLARSSRVFLEKQDHEDGHQECTNKAGGLTVLPIFHTLDDLSPATGRVDLSSLLPCTGRRAVVRVGAPVEYADLVEEYVAGKVAAGAERESVLRELSAWGGHDGDSELRLYASITDRVQSAVGALA
jgi:hypothetical protein